MYIHYILSAMIEDCKARISNRFSLLLRCIGMGLAYQNGMTFYNTAAPAPATSIAPPTDPGTIYQATGVFGKHYSNVIYMHSYSHRKICCNRTKEIVRIFLTV